MKQHHPFLNIRASLYTLLLLSFPVFVLFSPRFPIAVTHARIDEVLLLAWLPIATLHYTKSARGYRSWNRYYFNAFFVLFAIFVFGLLLGESGTKWSVPNFKTVTRPIFVILNILVIRFWIYRSHIKRDYILAGLIVAIAMAGALGCIAMFNPILANVLRGLYSTGIENYLAQGFNMSSRAMSVFEGYDQASMTYAFGSMLSLYMFFNTKKPYWKAFSSIMIIVLLVSILSSARTGFVVLFFGLITFLLPIVKGRMRTLIIACSLLGAVSLFLIPLLKDFFPDNVPIERFMDMIALFDLTSSLPFWERSHGVHIILTTQVFPVLYPHGIEKLFGFGDNGMFISDVAYVTVFVKYGIIGLVALCFAFLTIGTRGYRTSKKIVSEIANNEKLIPINGILPGLIILFAFGSLKGGLYFITYKIGELFAFVLALCIVESEQYLRQKIKLTLPRKALGMYDSPSNLVETSVKTK